MLARYLDARWVDLGRPEPFTVVDAGAGPGTLARSILAAQPSCVAAMRYVAVDVSATQRALHPAEIESRGDLPDEPIDGVIVANELLDNLPIRLCVFDGGWREAFVVDAGDGRFGEVLSAPLDPLPSGLAGDAGARIPRPAARCRGGMGGRCSHSAAQRSAARHRLLPADDRRRWRTRPWRDWLRTYRGHERGDHYLVSPGSQDITAEVALDQFPDPDAVSSQVEFLQRWGIDDLVAEGERRWVAKAAAPDLGALAMRSRAIESKALLDPTGLGAFVAAEWSGTVCPR